MIRCRLFGHKPHGPINPWEPRAGVLYRCDRCRRVIRFDRDRGWRIAK